MTALEQAEVLHQSIKRLSDSIRTNGNFINEDLNSVWFDITQLLIILDEGKNANTNERNQG